MRDAASLCTAMRVSGHWRALAWVHIDIRASVATEYCGTWRSSVVTEGVTPTKVCNVLVRDVDAMRGTFCRIESEPCLGQWCGPLGSPAEVPQNA